MPWDTRNNSSGGSAGPAGTGGWQTALDVDFAALASQALAADGVYPLGGVNWTKSNSASDRLPAALVNGQGIVIQPIGNTTITNTQWNLPEMATNLSAIIHGFSFDTDLRIWLYIQAQNSAANYDEQSLHLYSRTAPPGGSFTGIGPTTNFNIKKLFDTDIFNGALAWLIQANYNGATLSQTSSNQAAFESPLTHNDNVIVATLIGGIGSGLVSAYSGLYAGGFPTVGALRKLGSVPTTQANAFADSWSYANDWWVGFGASRQGPSATNLSATFGRMRIDYHT